MENNNQKFKIGIMGLGMVGGALQRCFESKGISVFKYDKGRKIGSVQEVNQAEIIFVCVPTPFVVGRGLDLSYVEDACSNVSGNKIIVIKSTILPGTTRKLQKKYSQHKFLFNPEFLVEERADECMQNPERQIIGYTESSRQLSADILAILPKAHFEKIVRADEAEMVKYFGNTFLSAKVIFSNQMYDLCKAFGIDYETVSGCVAEDKRITPSHLNIFHDGYRGYGGKCLPKDTKSLIVFADEQGVDMGLLKIVEDINEKLIKEQGFDLELLKKVEDIENKHAS